MQPKREKLYTLLITHSVRKDLKEAGWAPREKGADERVLNIVGDQATPAIITEIKRDAKSSGGS